MALTTRSRWASVVRAQRVKGIEVAGEGGEEPVVQQRHRVVVAGRLVHRPQLFDHKPAAVDVVVVARQFVEDRPVAWPQVPCSPAHSKAGALNEGRPSWILLAKLLPGLAAHPIKGVATELDHVERIGADQGVGGVGAGGGDPAAVKVERHRPQLLAALGPKRPVERLGGRLAASRARPHQGPRAVVKRRTSGSGGPCGRRPRRCRCGQGHQGRRPRAMRRARRPPARSSARPCASRSASGRRRSSWGRA